MFKSISVHLLAVLLLALTIYGAHVKGDEELGDTENQKEASSEQNVEVDNDSWIENLMWNLLGYAKIIVPSACIIRMLKNSNFNERSGKMFGLFVLRVHPDVVHVCFCLKSFYFIFVYNFFFI